MWPVMSERAAISMTAAWLSIAVAVTYQILIIALIFIRPDLDPSWHTISEWAIGPQGWLAHRRHRHRRGDRASLRRAVGPTRSRTP
jgi:hypothetical protein